MEIFLLLVIIVLFFVFNAKTQKRFRELQKSNEELKKTMSQQLKLLNEKEPIQFERPKTEEKQKTEEPVIIQEKVPEPVLEKPVIDEKVNVVKEEPEIVQMPVIEKPVKKTPVKVPQPSFFEKFRKNNPDLEKFIGENLLSKIAISILVIGIAFFVKYAIDKDWINEGGRVGIGILTGAILMGFAHKLHAKFKPFSSVLVAGAVAVFYFTIAIGFHEYKLFSQTTAFVIMFIITAFSVFVSIGYDRSELAALALTGGFAVPLMLSTGEGNYKVLFTYILILDLGMLVLAYIKKWNIINILSYVYTVILFTAWLGTKVVGKENAPFAGAFLFANVFYLVFVLMNIVNNIKERRKFSYVELIILISNNFVFYISSMLVLKEYAWQYKGIYTVLMGMSNFILAFLLQKKFKSDKNLVYLLLGMTLTFATLAAPVQLKGSYITMFWAAETLLLVWLAQRTQLKAFKLASAPVVFLMFISLVIDLSAFYGTYEYVKLPIFVNKACITGLFSSLALFFASFLLNKEKREEQPKWYDFHPQIYGRILLITALILAYTTGMLETYHQSDSYIYSGDSVAGICFFYHFAVTGLVGSIMLRKYTTARGIISFVLLCFNIFLYLMAYSIIPYEELRGRIYGSHASYLAYVYHFGSFLLLVMHFILVIKTGIKANNFIVKGKIALTWIFGFFGVFILSNEVLLNFLVLKMSGFTHSDYFIVQDVYDYVKSQIIKTALPVSWGLISFALLSYGIKRQVRSLRILALLLLAVTLIKLFFYDIKDVSEAGKIVAFILLGLMLLVMSFMYQKIKAILMDDSQNNDNEKKDQNNIV